MSHTDVLEDFWRTLITDNKFIFGSQTENAVFSYYPELTFPVFNHASCINVRENEAKDFINKVKDFYEVRDFPSASILVSPLTRPKNLCKYLLEDGFSLVSEFDFMVYEGSEKMEQIESELNIQPVTEKSVDIFSQILIDIFEFPEESRSAFRKLSRIRYQNGAKYYIGYLEDKPVGISGLLFSSNVGLIFGVGTYPHNRGKGIGTAMTIHVLNESKHMKHSVHTLQVEKTNNAKRIYEKLGFKTDHQLEYYMRNIK